MPLELPPEFGEYESAIFKMPKMKCNNPEDAAMDSQWHSLAGAGATLVTMYQYKCPVHSTKMYDAHILWARERELYATAKTEQDRKAYMNAMLDTVTDNNPPNRPDNNNPPNRTAATPPATKPTLNRVAIAFTVALILWVALATFSFMMLT
jgi:hypothetical protein